MAESNTKNMVGLVFILAIAAFMAWWFLGRSHNGGNFSRAFFIDEETGEQSIGSAFEYPPLIGKGGKPTVVQVFKITCDGGKTTKVAYYMKYTDETKKHLDASYAETKKSPEFDASLGLLVRSPEKGSHWVLWRSAEAAPVKDALSCPDGHDVETVFP